MQYNFEYMYKAIIALDEAANEPYPGKTVEQACDALKYELNKFMPDFRCNEVIFNNNTDKQFFGIFIRPLWYSPMEFAKKIMAGYGDFGFAEDGNVIDFERFNAVRYSIELDGKLFRNFNLNPPEICSIIIKELLSVNDPEIYVKLRGAIDTYMSLKEMTPCVHTISDTCTVFEMVCTITLHNMTCLFSMYDPEVTLDTLNEFGLGKALQNAIGKIIANGAKPDEIDKTSMLISWYFSHYKDLKNSRQYQYMLRNCISTESSKLIQLMLMLSLKEIDGVTTSDDRYFKSKYMTESTKRKGLLYQMKKNGLRSIEEDLFEYNMRLRNVETQDDAILLMRQINSRMSILEEYLDTEELDEKDRKRWEDCYKKYLELRDALSKKTVYNKKMYGLFVDYNALQNMSQSGNLMNTYY